MEITEVRIKLYVGDFDRRREFYKRTLGWKVRHEWIAPEGERGVMFQISSTVFELLEDTSARRHDAQVDLSIQVSDVHALWEELQNKAEVGFKLRDNSWGDTSFCIVDPGGFPLIFFSQKK